VSKEVAVQQTGRASSRVGWIVGLVILGAAGAGAMLLYRNATAAGEPPAESAVPVMIRPVARVERPVSFEVSGEVEARRTVDLAFKVPGVVETVAVDEGQAVTAGQVIAELEATEYELAMELAAAQAELAQDAHRRASQLNQQSSIPAADFVKAQVALRQANAQHELARTKVADTRMLSPISGVVARRGVDPGEQAAPGFPMFTIVQVNPAQVRVGVPEAEIGGVRTGQTATVRLPALPGVSIEGRVELVGVVADPVSRTYVVKISLPNQDGMLRPGMIAEASIRDEARFSLMTIPGEAVVPDHEGVPVIYVYDPQEQRVYSRQIRVGTVYGEEIEVVSGLTGDELVVIGGQHRVRDGSRVEATTAEVEAAAAPAAPAVP
jgi:RND family efflux transporter MFP subunit